MKYFPKVCLALSLIFLVVVSSVGAAGFLDNYAMLRPGKYIEGFYIDNQALHQKGYLTMSVKDVDVSQIKNSWGLEAEEAAVFVKRELQEAARRTQIERFFLFDTANQGQAVLEVAITEQSSGTPIGRFLVWLLGWGQPFLRVEGRVRDLQSNQIIASFSHYKSCKAIWPLRDLGHNGGIVMLREMYAIATDEIMREIGNAFGFIPETLKDDLPFKYN